MSYDAPFAGLKVVDLSQGIAGPYCGMLLAQHGADVVKVEPLEGDWSRTLSNRFGDHTAFSIAGNLGKRSIALDLKSADGKAVLRKLVTGADVFVEGFRPGVIGRLGFDYGAVRALNRRALYLSVSGFGQSGPFAERPALDPILQAFTGMMADTKLPDGTPHRVGGMVIDMATGLYAFQAVSAALYARRDLSEGRYLEASLMSTGAALQAVGMLKGFLDEWKTQPGRCPNGIFKTRDGWVMLIILGEKEFPPFCKALGKPDLPSDPRFASNAARLANAEVVNAMVREAMAQHTTAAWCERLTAAGTLHEAVNDFEQYVSHPHVTATGAVTWLHQPGVSRAVPLAAIAGVGTFPDGKPRGTSPTLGQHSAAVLAELGYDRAMIGDLARRKVVAGVTGA